MSFKKAEATLASAVADNGTFTVSYPAGTQAGSYAGAHAHKMWAAGHQKMYAAPNDFTLSFGASNITVTYKGSTTLQEGSRVHLQLDTLGADDGEPEKAVVNAQILPANIVQLDLGSPITADTDGFAASQSVAEGAAFVLNGILVSNGVGINDVPRNVVAAWSNAAVLTITGKDVDGNTVVETSASGTSHTGSKAFKSITSVTSSASITGATVGQGVKLGLPAYVPDASMILQELRNGVALPRKSGKVFLTAQQTEALVDAGTGLNLISPVAGRIAKMSTIAQAGITTGGAVTLEVNTVAVDGLSVTIANSSSEGDIDSDVPTAGHATAVVAVGDRLEVQFAAAIDSSSDLFIIIEIDTTAAGQLDGTLVAGVTTAATGTTGDTRGTYSPSATPDGTYGYKLLAILPDPANQGVPQYAG